MVLTRVGNDLTVSSSDRSDTFAISDFDGFAVPDRVGALTDATRAQLAHTLSNVVNGMRGDVGHRQALAQHLLDVLVDPAQQEALLGPESAIDFGLDLRAADLAGLPWEIVLQARVGGKSLARNGCTVTRIVAVSPSVVPFNRPVRILFVAGAPLGDPVVHPGTEFYAVSQAYASSEIPFATKVLLHPSVEELGALVNSFEPDVLHFAGHGKFAGRGLLELRDGHRQGQKVWHNADAIIAAMNGTLPKMLILSACETGEVAQRSVLPSTAARSSSMAAEFVTAGIPVVVGMSGRIADAAARLFTRSLMSTIAKGKDLIKSVADARIKAMTDDAARDSDWVFPGLFVASSVPGDYAPSRGDLSEPAAHLRKVQMAFLFPQSEPMLCQREHVWSRYAAVVGKGPERTLLMSGEKGMGKGRMIRELLAHTIREGNLPVVVSSVRGNGTPEGLPWLAKNMGVALRKTADTYGKDDFRSSLLVKVTREQLTLGDLPVPLQGLYELDGEVLAPHMLARIFELEIRKLESDLRGQGLIGSQAQAVVFIDDLQEVPAEFVEQLLSGSTPVLTQWGIGSSSPAIPFIASYLLDGVAKDRIDGYSRAGEHVAVVELGPFSTVGSADLRSYEQILLNPFLLNRPDKPARAGDVFAFAPGVIVDGQLSPDKVGLDSQVVMLRRLLEGPLTKLSDGMLYHWANSMHAGQLMTASDEYAYLIDLGMTP